MICGLPDAVTAMYTIGKIGAVVALGVVLIWIF
jgi:hypothetical protein